MKLLPNSVCGGFPGDEYYGISQYSILDFNSIETGESDFVILVDLNNTLLDADNSNTAHFNFIHRQILEPLNGFNTR